MFRRQSAIICETYVNLILLVCLLPYIPRPALAQATTGSIIGSVTDPSGAAVPSARATIRNLDQNSTTIVDTNESGNYTKGRTHSRPVRDNPREDRIQVI
jgi:hypothetical protein